jgi:hypothetical protein
VFNDATVQEILEFSGVNWLALLFAEHVRGKYFVRFSLVHDDFSDGCFVICEHKNDNKKLAASP